MTTYIVCRGYPGALWLAVQECTVEADNEEQALQEGLRHLGIGKLLATWAWTQDEYYHQRTVRAARRAAWSQNHPATSLSHDYRDRPSLAG